eukprot:5433997-Karenia_brevis.AAC.1
MATRKGPQLRRIRENVVDSRPVQQCRGVRERPPGCGVLWPRSTQKNSSYWPRANETRMPPSAF